ncbi:uncharacterized protein LOC130792511 [Actinidia eriantha]|uniref:Uncharacterized protein n=1 Tax=Actinidia rufa TaxID=165716 RepID=A0A7J0DXG5_9ERIC|nr:uncharacterized protein LOC130792511 [Actinidia eriantha]GFS44787.1 hypothetical protein Acr_00g0091960 [Actinidia rufa]
MAKSLRSKREKRLRAIRREIVVREPIYEKKEAAKLAAQEAALAAPKLLVRSHKSNDTTTAMEMIATPSTTGVNADVEMDEGNQSMKSLKPVGKIGKKLRKKIKMAKRKNRGGKGKIRKKHNV